MPLLMVMVIAGCEDRVGITNPPVITIPTVTATTPLNAAISVAYNSNVTATFSDVMDPTTITTASFTLMQGTSFVSGIVSYTGRTATFAPVSNLTANTVYTATITVLAKNIQGGELAHNYVWSFTTATSPLPTVSSTDPLSAAIGVAFNKHITATFSKTMDASTITTASFTLMQGTTFVSGAVSYTGTTATFTPASNLTANTVYTATITTGAMDNVGNSIASNYVWSFTTAASTLPAVSSTDPLNAATGVAYNKIITAIFNKSMDASTITTATFTIMQGHTFISGTVSYTGTTATYTPLSNLSANTVYTATITTGAKDLAGNFLASNYVWSFTTAASTPPTVISTDPLNSATGVVLNKQITATFSKTMRSSTINTTTFTLTQGSTPVSGVVSYTGTTATFIPASNLTPNTVYTATITTGANDFTGNALASNYVWSFTTLSLPAVNSTDPVNNAINIHLDKVISAVFNKTMDASTITTATFTLMQGQTFVAGTVSYSGTTASFTPLSIMNQNTTYTATITTGAKDLAGNSMTSNYVWTFKTGTLYTVAVSSNPTLGGTSTGSGTFYSGSSVTVNATANTGYTFIDWKEGGVEVSTNASYTFTISANRTLVANYSLNGPVVVLGTAKTYGALGGTAGMTNQGIFTIVNGDMGTTAVSTSITGFHDTGGDYFTETPLNVGQVNGVINCAPPLPGTATKFAAAQQALLDATAAYNFLAGLPGGSDPGAGELGSLVLTPGTYTASLGSFKITSGDLTLDAQNNPNAVFIFQMSTSLTVGLAGQPRSIILVNGAQAKNIYWQVGSAATINGAGGGTMYGTIIAYSGVTFSTAGVVAITTLNGRALSLISSVTMVNTVVNVQ